MAIVNGKQAMQIAAAGWIVLLLVVFAIVAVQGRQTVLPAWRTAA